MASQCRPGDQTKQGEAYNACYWNNRHPLCEVCHSLYEGREWTLPVPIELRRHRLRNMGSPQPEYMDDEAFGRLASSGSSVKK